MKRDRFTFVGVFLLSLYLVGIPVAILGKLPAQFDTSGDSTQLFRDAITTGTAISAPFFLLILLAAFLLLARRRGWRKIVGIVGATILGLFFTVGSVGELVSYNAFSGTRQLVFLVWNALTFPLAMALVVLGITTLVRFQRSRKPTSA